LKGISAAIEEEVVKRKVRQAGIPLNVFKASMRGIIIKLSSIAAFNKLFLQERGIREEAGI
jgi:hypothetical protein